MKNYVMSFFVILLITFCACCEETYYFQVDKPERLAILEQLNQYDALKTYIDKSVNPDFKLGIGVGLSEYTNSVIAHKLIIDNFDEITLGWEMKHGAVVQADGSLDFSNLDKLFEEIPQAGTSIFGHTLIWHTNQNAFYLNSLFPGDVTNLWVITGLSGGTFSSSLTNDNWSKRGGADNVSVENGNLVMKSVNAGGLWDLEVASPRVAVNRNHKYQVSFTIKSDKPGKLRNTFEGDGVTDAWLGVQYTPADFGDLATTEEWKEVSYVLNEDGGFLANATNLNVNFLCGEIADVTYYIQVNSLKLIDLDANTNAGNTDNVDKETIITEQMEKWISEMVTYCRPYTRAWDVVNEPMDDGQPDELKTGIGKTDMAADEFYWQDYFDNPKDYAVKAFQLTRRYANESDKLFINDYGLEWNLDKCRGLVEYVKYIDQKAGTAIVDGIGTQMHCNIALSHENIDEMFKILVASGKLVKISELDITAGEAHVPYTEEELKKQADLYQYIVESYFRHVPKAQRYGIFVWGITDSGDQNTSWLNGHEQC
ncbi:MAG: endo-1,4-beta-xylanase, partial [Dysgonamonadaceae bacterium]|nr:endo-1,4-beta-xylanase [Dysgonamonadaceae bacterium]